MSATTSGFSLSRRATLAGGQPISELMSRALENPHLISLAAGFVDNETLPVEIAGEVLADMMADREQARRMLQYGTTPGLPVLRAALLEWIHRESPIPATCSFML